MKLAEALLLRADMQKKLLSLKDRIADNVLLQEGETPSEDPASLIEDVRRISQEMKSLIYRTNQANYLGKTSQGRSLTEAIAERDSLAVEHSILKSIVDSASKAPDRYGSREIRWVRTISIQDLQKDLDKIAKNIREVNIEIQSANWQLEIE